MQAGGYAHSGERAIGNASRLRRAHGICHSDPIVLPRRKTGLTRINLRRARQCINSVHATRARAPRQPAGGRAHPESARRARVRVHRGAKRCGLRAEDRVCPRRRIADGGARSGSRRAHRKPARPQAARETERRLGAAPSRLLAAPCLMRALVAGLLLALASAAAAQPPEASAALERAYQEMLDARKALEQDEAARKLGIEPRPGERLAVVGGRSRLTPEYWERQQRLEEERRARAPATRPRARALARVALRRRFRGTARTTATHGAPRLPASPAPRRDASPSGPAPARRCSA
jgi:hypothetical protein